MLLYCIWLCNLEDHFDRRNHPVLGWFLRSTLQLNRLMGPLVLGPGVLTCTAEPEGPLLCRRDSRLCSPRSRAFGRRQVQGAKARAARRTQPEIYGTTGASFCAASPSCPPPPFPRCSVRRLPPRSTTTSRCYPRSPRRFCSLLPPLRGRARAPGAPSSPPPGIWRILSAQDTTHAGLRVTCGGWGISAVQDRGKARSRLSSSWHAQPERRKCWPTSVRRATRRTLPMT